MSLRLEMLQVARLAPRLLGEATPLVVDFFRSQLNADGGFKTRDGQSDLYYTVFGLQGLLALRVDPPVEEVAAYLRTFEDGHLLDLVHASCLARCWAALPTEVNRQAPRSHILRHIESFRSNDGAYHISPGSDQGTLYGCFLALGAYQDLGAALPDPAAVVKRIERLRAEDGGYSNQDDLPIGLTPPTAAAVALLRNLGRPVPVGLTEWFLARHHLEGGFYATSMAPLPDLLSTATALHALSGLHADVRPIKEACIDFVDSLWTNTGGFYGNWAEDATDCEYTYYALLALGHLSL